MMNFFYHVLKRFVIIFPRFKRFKQFLKFFLQSLYIYGFRCDSSALCR